MSGARPITSRRLAELVRVALLIVAVWVLFGIFSSSEFYRRMVETSSDRALPEVFWFQQTTALLWAWFTPLIVFVAERLPLQGRRAPRNALLLLPVIVLVAVARAAAGGAILDLFEQQTVTLHMIVRSIELRLVRNIGLTVVVIGLTNLVLAHRAAAERERHALALKAAVANAALHQLRASMQPRFMLATLEAIAAKVQQYPETAERMITQLGWLLRSMPEFEHRRDVSLAEELEMSDRYLDIERTRTAGRFVTRTDVPEELLGARVPPLLLTALVESMVPGREAEPPGRLEIGGRANDGLLVLEIHVRGVSPAPVQEALDEARARLRHAFGDVIGVSWRRSGADGATALTMPLILPGEGAAA